jgi:hypothetical protein
MVIEHITTSPIYNYNVDISELQHGEFIVLNAPATNLNIGMLLHDCIISKGTVKILSHDNLELYRVTASTNIIYNKDVITYIMSYIKHDINSTNELLNFNILKFNNSLPVKITGNSIELVTDYIKDKLLIQIPITTEIIRAMVSPSNMPTSISDGFLIRCYL